MLISTPTPYLYRCCIINCALICARSAGHRVSPTRLACTSFGGDSPTRLTARTSQNAVGVRAIPKPLASSVERSSRALDSKLLKVAGRAGQCCSVPLFTSFPGIIADVSQIFRVCVCRASENWKRKSPGSCLPLHGRHTRRRRRRSRGSTIRMLADCDTLGSHRAHIHSHSLHAVHTRLRASRHTHV